jgi:hypothetical protein
VSKVAWCKSVCSGVVFIRVSSGLVLVSGFNRVSGLSKVGRVSKVTTISKIRTFSRAVTVMLCYLHLQPTMSAVAEPNDTKSELCKGDRRNLYGQLTRNLNCMR